MSEGKLGKGSLADGCGAPLHDWLASASIDSGSCGGLLPELPIPSYSLPYLVHGAMGILTGQAWTWPTARAATLPVAGQTCRVVPTLGAGHPQEFSTDCGSSSFGWSSEG